MPVCTDSEWRGALAQCTCSPVEDTNREGVNLSSVYKYKKKGKGQNEQEKKAYSFKPMKEAFLKKSM